MGKYFSENSSIHSQYPVTPENTVEVRATPLTDNLTQPLSEEKKQKLSLTPPKKPETTGEYVSYVEQQSNMVSQMVKDYSAESKQEIEKKFEKFTPLEMFEKINQLFFVVADLSNRVATLDATIQTLINIATKGAGIQKPTNAQRNITNPHELHGIQEQLEKGIKIDVPQQSNRNQSSRPNTPSRNVTNDEPMDISQVKEMLGNIQKGKGLKGLPMNGYTDNSINLEEVFPNREDGAYQAAYQVLNERKLGEGTAGNDEVVQRNMKQIVGF